VREQFVIYKLQQLVAGHPLVRIRSPITPAKRLPYRRPVLLIRQRATFFEVVKRLQEQNPGKLRYPVKVAIQPRILSHDVTRGFDDAGEACGGGGLDSNR